MVNQWIPDATNPNGGSWLALGSEKGIESSGTTLAEQISLAKAGLIIDESGKVVKAPEPVNEVALAEAKTKVNLIDSLLIVDAGLDVAVGPNKGARCSPFEIFSAKRTNFVAGVEQLISKESLESLIAAKAKGATFGALSDTEMAILRSAATKIAGWRVDKDGNPVSDPSLVAGYKITEKKFLEELNLLKEKTNEIIKLAELENNENKGLNTFESKIDDYYLNNPDKRDFIDQLEQNGMTDEEKLQILGIDFNQVGSDTQPAVNVALAGQNIKSVTIGGRVVRVDQQISSKIQEADKEMFKATGMHLQINQSFRSRAQQQELFDRLSKTGGRVAPPGSSFHEKGLAIDVTNWKEAEPFLRAVGLLNNLADDKGHFSIGEFNNLV